MGRSKSQRSPSLWMAHRRIPLRGDNWLVTSPSKDFSLAMKQKADVKVNACHILLQIQLRWRQRRKADEFWTNFSAKSRLIAWELERFYLFRIMSGDGIPSSPPGSRSLARETFGKVRTDTNQRVLLPVHVARFNECPKICAPVA